MASNHYNNNEEIIKLLNNNYKPQYLPIFAYFTKREQHNLEKGIDSQVEVKLVLDDNNMITPKSISPHQTDNKAIYTNTTKKSFNKNFYSLTHKISNYQNKSHLNSITQQILDKMTLFLDILFFNGEYDSNQSLLNNGLWNSNDNDDFITETSTSLSSSFTINDIKTKLDALVFKSESILGNGRKTIYLVGDLASYMGKFIGNDKSTTFIQAITEAYRADGRFINLEVVNYNISSKLANNNNSGVLIVSNDNITTHYCIEPELYKIYENYDTDDVSYKFRCSSMSPFCDIKGAIIKQIITVS